MRKTLLFVAIILSTVGAKAQDTLAKSKIQAELYSPAADAKAEIDAAVKEAALTHKNVMLQIGGNWCIWCHRFHDLVVNDPELSKYLNYNYITVHVNYSKENMNEKVLADLAYPQRFGFPVFVVLDDKGNRIHTQNSGYLEEGKGHSKEKVMEFFKDWSPAAIDPKTYQKGM